MAIWNGVPWLACVTDSSTATLGVDYDLVWGVATTKIPGLQQAVEHILRQEGSP
jgi:uncharacterized protein with HEPN domain